MAKKEAKLTTFSFAQELKPQYWPGLTDDEQKIIEAADKGIDVQNVGMMLFSRCKAAGLAVTDFHFIVHDRDTKLAWSDSAGCEVVNQVANHVHGVVRCDAKGGGTLGAVAAAVGVEPQYVEKPRPGRYSYDNMLAYLVHAKYSDKFQYAKDDVRTVVGRPFDEIYAERYAAWMKARGTVEKKKAADNIDDLEYQILTGQITKSQVMLTDELFSIYARNRRRCNDAFASFAERKAEKAAVAIKNGDWRLTVFYITGKPGVGKSWFAEKFVEYICEANRTEEGGQPWEVFKTAASNPLDRYIGEEVILMDDVRGTAMSAEDWLKLIDAEHVNTASARYDNVRPVPRVVVIASYKDPIEFFYYTRTGGGDRGEALDQFIRRIQSVVQVIEYDEDRQYKLSASKKDEPQDVRVPGALDKWGNPVTVKMEYGFSELGSYSMDEAIHRMAAIVRSNDRRSRDEADCGGIDENGEIVYEDEPETGETAAEKQEL